MKELKGIKTRTYEYDDEYRVDIIETEDPDNKGYKYWEAFLYHKNYGTKTLMFGTPELQPHCIYGNETYDGFLESVWVNAPWYINTYEEEAEENEKAFEELIMRGE